MTTTHNLDTFREAVSRFPSGVTIVTTTDVHGKPRGFTASAFASLSHDPPMVLVCLSRTAECFPAFAESDSFTVNILKPEHTRLAQLFATRGADKFASRNFQWARTHPTLHNALAAIHCHKNTMINGGDHTILTGTVHSTEVTDGTPTVYFDRDFHTIT